MATNGPAILPGNAKDSLLYKLIAHEQEPAMPYKAGKLPDDVIARFAEWIDARRPVRRISGCAENRRTEPERQTPCLQPTFARCSKRSA